MVNRIRNPERDRLEITGTVTAFVVYDYYETRKNYSAFYLFIMMGIHTGEAASHRCGQLVNTVTHHRRRHQTISPNLLSFWHRIPQA